MRLLHSGACVDYHIYPNKLGALFTHIMHFNQELVGQSINHLLDV